MKIFEGNITQLNTGDLQGKLYNSFNCDLTFNKGKMLIAPRTILNTDSITNMGVPIGFKYFDNRWFTIAGTRVFRGGSAPQDNYVEDTSFDSPTNCSADYSDIENFNDVLLVSSDNRLYSKVANTNGTGDYTLRRTFISTTDYHSITTYNNRAYWLDSNEPPRIFSMGTSYSVSTTGTYTLQLPLEYEVTFIRTFSNGLYIGTIHRFSGEAVVFEWDGVTQNKWNRFYRVFANGALAGFVENDILFVVNTNGELLKFNGAGFTVAGKLPIKRELLFRSTNVQNTNRFIHPRGITAINGYISMLINNRLNSTSSVKYHDNIHSGVWEYDDTSLYHKHSLSYRTRPDLGGSITDYGQITLDRVGALQDTPDRFDTTDVRKGNFLAGASYYSTSSTSTGIGYGIWTDNYYDDVQKAGFFTTVQIRPENFEEMWQQITLLYTPLENFKYVVKYRTEREEHVDFDLTWTSTNTFTTTQTGISVGDEITIIQGKGSGRIAHVSEISFSTPNFTVTLDETITGVTGTARGRKENWTKCGEITNTVTKFSTEPIGQPDTLVEIKVAMLATGEVSIDEMILDSKKHQ